VDGLVEELKRQRAAGNRERRERERASAGGERLTALCDEVAGWGPASVVEPGWREADAADTVVQLAWAIRDLHAAVAACGLVGRLGELAAGAVEPAACYAWGLLRLAGGEGKRLELEDRVRAAWADPTVWREVARWFRMLPTLLDPSAAGTGVESPVEGHEPDRQAAAAAPRRSVDSPYLTAGEAAEYLRTTVQGVYSLRKRNLLHPLPGRTGRLLFTREALDRCLEVRRRGR
jgi:hypothetical protein